MRNLDSLSGPWVGFWIQDMIRGSMGLSLTFSGGKILGGGSDLVGGFKLKGAYADDGSVVMGKTYQWHAVIYKGRWDGQMISGEWTIKGEDSGLFEIWPESDAMALNEFAIAEELETVGQR
jgi:hypothetical protein